MFVNTPKNKTYDVIIIGAGAAGITIAHKLAEQGKIQALLIESGDLTFTPEATALSKVEADGHFHANHYSIHSQRIFGGTTSIWSNMTSKLEERSFLNNEWGIQFSDIHPYYEEATDIVTLRDKSFTHTKASFTKRDIIQYRPYYKSYKRSTRMGEKYLDELSASTNIDVLLNSTCININQTNKTASAITIRPTKRDGQDFEVSGSLIIVACGGIGNPRLLQLSSIGSELPVGQYLMEHPEFIDPGFIEVNVNKLEPVIQTSKTIHAFSLSDQYCLDNKLLNATISFKDHTTESRPLLGTSTDCFTSIASLRTEMPALKENKTFLLDEKDDWGLPKQKVTLNLIDKKQGEALWDIFAKELLVSNAGRLSVFSEEHLKYNGGGHLMGTTRMGKSTQTSVVDANCKVHGVDNLFVAGSSIFSASAAANPTYSIIAFSLRLSEHIIKLVSK